MLIKAAVLHNYHEKFVIEDVELAEPGMNQIRVKVVGCGVCHTDEAVRNGFATPMPAVLGHEGSGIVEKAGPGVTGFQPGDHVVLSYASCGECVNCLTGKANICLRMFELDFLGRMADGSTPLSQNGRPLSMLFGQSTFATHSVVNVRNVVKVDPEFDLRYLGPLGCGFLTGSGAIINTIRPMPGSSIAIFGAGSVGLSAVMAAKACGCTTIISVDIFDQRLHTARELGATHVINSKVTPDIVGEIKKIAKNGVDHAFESTGVPICVQSALEGMRSGGKGCSVAITGKVEVSGWTNWFRGKSWSHCIEGDAIPQVFIPQLLRLYKNGLFPFDKLVTLFDFKDINEAFEANHSGAAIKPILVMP